MSSPISLVSVSTWQLPASADRSAWLDSGTSRESVTGAADASWYVEGRHPGRLGIKVGPLLPPDPPHSSTQPTPTQLNRWSVLIFLSTFLVAGRQHFPLNYPPHLHPR